MHESTGHLHPEPCDVVDRRAATALAAGEQPEHRDAGRRTVISVISMITVARPSVEGSGVARVAS